MKASFLYTLKIITWVWFIFLLFANLTCEECTLVVVFIFISLLSNELEHLSIYSLVIYLFFFLCEWDPFSMGSVMKKEWWNCQAVLELQIKALQPKAQPPTPSCNVYTTAKRSTHTWESAGSVLNLQERVCVRVCVYVCARVLNHVWRFETPGTVACQAPLSMVFSRQEYWSGLPLSTPGDLPNPGSNPHLLCLLHRQVDSLSLCHQGSMRGEGISSIGILILCFK